MSNSIHNVQTLLLVFITMMMVMSLYLYVAPQWDPLKDLGWDLDCCVRNTEEDSIKIEITIKTDNSQDYTPYDNIITSPTYPEDPKDVPFTIVTAASMDHFCSLKSMIYANYETIKDFNKARVIIYDLGLSEEQKEELIQLQEKGYITELRPFKWSKYPSFWNITIDAGQYAWKPGIIHEISIEYPGIIIWLDSESKAQKHLFKNLGKFLKRFKGFISPRSSGNMKQWTHPGVYKYFQDNHKKYDLLPNCNAASLIFDTRITQSLIDAWYDCALNKRCIAPRGSSRENHRQDQSLLTYLAAKEGRFCRIDRNYFGLKVHDDSGCDQEIYDYEHTGNIIFKNNG